MQQPLLEVNDLTTWFDTREGRARVVDGNSFRIHRGETFALLGESGCGKSMTALSLMRLLPSQAQGNISGQVLLDGEDLLQLPEAAMRRIRGNRIAMIFQEPMTSLNPVLTIGEQIAEVLRRHRGLHGEALQRRLEELLTQVGIPAPRQRLGEYPHQLSGGMKQRVMIAIALAGEPDLLIADEPTTALDVTIQAQVLGLLKELQAQTGMAVLMITHDLGVVAEMVDRVAVMYAGQIVEQASREAFFAQPQHPYSQKLFEALPEIHKRDRLLSVIPGSVPPLTQAFRGCRFAPRCQRAWELCHQREPQWLPSGEARSVRCHLYDRRIPHPEPVHEVPRPLELAHAAAGETLLEVRDLKVHFPIRQGLLKRVKGYVYAVDGVDLSLRRGQTLALVGESGCGKTTLGKSILQLLRPTAGEVRFEGEDLTRLRGEALRRRRRDFQIIFQDPFSSMNPRMMVGDIIAEGMQAQGIGGDRTQRLARVDELLQQVGLKPEHKFKYPHEFSGGQRQRICIARTLAVDPRLIVCDEPTSALDVSVQAQILNLLRRLQQELHLSYLFITHDISVVAYLADEVAVMYLGRVVEQGPVASILEQARHPYTQALLAAVPRVHADTARQVVKLEGDPPSPMDPPAGCHFHPRCPQASAACRERYPGQSQVAPGHWVRCHLYP